MEERTIAAILSGDSVSIKLGGRSFEIAPQPMKRAQAFRTELAKVLDETALLPMIADKLFGDEKDNKLNAAELIEAIKVLIGSNIGSLFGLVHSWAMASSESLPDGIDAKTFIEENATEYEAVDALAIMAGFVFGPFGRLQRTLTGMKLPSEISVTPPSATSTDTTMTP